MSRFFASVDDDDESESSVDSEEDEQVRPRKVSYSSDEQDIKRVVKSIKSKIIDETKAVANSINNVKKINDFAGLLTRFEELVKISKKHQNEFKENGPPGIFIACLADLLTYVSASWDDITARKSLTKIGSKSLASIRQKIRKFCKMYENEIAEYNENPSKVLKVDVEETEDIEKRDRSVSPIWDDSSESDSDSSDGTPFTSMRDKFLKKAGQKETQKLDKREKKIREVKMVEDDENKGWQTVRGGSVSVKSPVDMFDAESEVTTGSIIDKLSEIVSRGGIKRSDRIKQLSNIFEVAMEKKLGAGILMKIRLAQVNALFDYNMSKQDFMKHENWSKALKFAGEIADFIMTGEFEIVPDIFEEDKLDVPPYKVRGCLSVLVQRLFEEQRKILKATEVYEEAYCTIYSDDKHIVNISDKFVCYLENKNQIEDLCRLKMCKIELLYSKFNINGVANAEDEIFHTLDGLCKFVCVHDKTQRLRTRAILAQIYHLALHDNWPRAKNLMLMSHLQASIEHADIDTQIFFNRTMAQLGLCAFRHGEVADAHGCLMYLVRGVTKTRQLLGQGVVFRREMTREEESKGKQQQVPPHLNIRPELIECAFMVSAMLVELPNLLAQGQASSYDMTRSFKFLLKNSNRDDNGPPEAIAQFVADACKALTEFKWQECINFLFNPTMDSKVWKRIEQPTPIKDKISPLIRKCALQLYAKHCAVQIYESLDLKLLSETFGMAWEEMYGILASLIHSGKLQASINVVNNTLIYHHGAIKSNIHELAATITALCVQQLEQSERTFGHIEHYNLTRRRLNTRNY